MAGTSASAALKAVLKELKCGARGKGEKGKHQRHTHTSMAGGSYRAASPEERGRLMDAYCDALDAGRVDLHLVEQPDAAAMPLLVDLDFRLPEGESERLYDGETIVDFVKGYVRCAGKYIERDLYVWYVLEKPSPRPKDGNTYKDGVHLVCPGVVTSAAVQRAIRADFLADPYNEGFFEAQGTASAEEAYDVAVLGTNAWMMYGSRKAKDDPSPWTATRVIEAVIDAAAGAITVRYRPVEESRPALARLLSVHRERTDATPLTAAGEAVAVVADGGGGGPKVPLPRTRPRSAVAPAAAAAVIPSSAVGEPMAPERVAKLAAVRRLARMLSAARSDAQLEWMKVGWCLRNVAADADEGGDDPRFVSGCAAAWDDFSRRSAKYREGEPAELWSRMEVRGAEEKRLNKGSLVDWARADSPAEYSEWDLKRAWGQETGLLQTMKGQFPQLGLGAAEGSFRVVRFDGEGVAFEDATAGLDGKGLTGTVDAPKPDYWGNTVSVRDNASGETRFLGLLLGSVPVRGPVSQLHRDIPSSANSFVFTQPEEHMALLSSVTPNVPAEIKLHYPGSATSSFLHITVPGTLACKISAKNKVDMFRSQVCRAFEQHNTLNLFANQLTINNNGSASEEAHRTAFIKLRDVAMGDGAEGRLRKLDGHIWRPVPGCPCAYEQAESYKDFLNKTLNDEAQYHSKPAYQKELLEYLNNYNPDALRDIEFDRYMLSFADGVLVASESAPEARFVPYGTAEAAELEGKVARHHIALPYAPAGSLTPLFDSVLSRQFTPEMAATTMVMIGRLLFPVGTHDNWQVMLWLVGLAGTGKSLVQDIVAAMFAPSATGTLVGNQEQTFGLDGKYNRHVLLGRDLPRKMAPVLSQELLQCMVSGERICVPRKNQLALEVRWTVPQLFASNQLPDYADSAGQIVRRIVPLQFRKPVPEPDPTLLQRILETELPALVSRAMDAYLAAAREHGRTGFWRWCPAELLAAQKEVGIATSYVKRFLSLGPDDEQAVSRGGEVVHLMKADGVITAVRAISAAYAQFMRDHYDGVRSSESINRQALELAGYTVKDEQNVCRTCSRMFTRGHEHPSQRRHCCDKYDSGTRNNLIAVVGYSLERTPAEGGL